MIRYVSAIVIILLSNCQTKKVQDRQEAIEVPFTPHIEMIDPSLSELLDVNGKVEIIAEGFDWSEGPVWVEGVGLLFSDIPPNKIYKWSENEGSSLYLTPSGYTDSVTRGGEVGSNGLLLDPDGNLVLCQHGDRRISRLDADLQKPVANYHTIIDRYQEKRFNSPNDACYASDGALYFTDPPYGLEHRMDDPSKELDFQGVYRLSNGSTEIQLLTDQMSRPNGIAFSPDETKLYVANSDPDQAIWMVYGVDENGMIDDGQVFYDATKEVGSEKGLPDGLKVDSRGNIYATGPGGVWIFDSDGKVLGKIRTGQATSNCNFDKERKILYITADMYVMRVFLKTV